MVHGPPPFYSFLWAKQRIILNRWAAPPYSSDLPKILWAEPLAESNPVLQDPLLAYPPCVYAGVLPVLWGLACADPK